jgi:hypothetical protein
MKISVNLRERLDGSLDDDMTFLKQLGVNLVNISAMPRDQATRNPIQNLKKLVKKIRDAQLKAHLLRFTIVDALLNKPEGEEQLKTACELIKFAGRASIPLI